MTIFRFLTMKFLGLIIIVLIPTSVVGQIIERELTTNEGEIVLSENITIPKEEMGYVIVLPDDRTATGLIVNFHLNKEPDPQDIQYALNRDIAVMYISTGNRLDFLFENQEMLKLEAYIQDAISAFQIPRDNMLFYGQSIGGTRALKMAIFSQTEDSQYQLTPKSIAMADSPLDFIRFWNAEQRALKDQHNEISVNEATWVTGYLERSLGGTPMSVPSNYIHFSPYTYSEGGGPHIESLNDMYIRAYHEPDVEWWMENRGKSFYEMNVIDGAALINDLQLRGSTKAELILTYNKGYYPDGTRHPHSGSIVDFEELIDWFNGQ